MKEQTIRVSMVQFTEKRDSHVLIAQTIYPRSLLPSRQCFRMLNKQLLKGIVCLSATLRALLLLLSWRVVFR